MCGKNNLQDFIEKVQGKFPFFIGLKFILFSSAELTRMNYKSIDFKVIWSMIY